MILFKCFVPAFNWVKKLCLFVLLLLIVSNSYGQSINFNDSMAILTKHQSPDQVIQQLNLKDLHFTKDPNRRFDVGLVENDYHYFVLKLNTPDTVVRENFISIDNTSLDTIQIYKMIANKSFILLYQGGNNMPFNTNRNYAWHTARVTIAAIPSYYLLAVKAAYKNINLRYDIMEQDALQKRNDSYQHYVFFYLGIVSMIAVVMLIAVVLFKQAVFGAYLGYTVCAGGWILAHYCCIFPMLYPNHPGFNQIIKLITSLGASLFLLQVLLLVFKNNLRAKPWLQKLLQTSIYTVATIMALMLCMLIPNLNSVVSISLVASWQAALFCSICVIVLTPLCFLQTGYTAKIFTAAVLVICIMTIVQQIANLGYIKSFFINEHAITVASLLEISIMAFGLFYHFYQDKNATEKQMVQLETERTEILKKLITVQDNERKRIAADLHDNLGPLLAALKINFRRIVYSKHSQQQTLVEKTESIIDDSIAEIRNVAHNLMPKSLSANGLIGTLNDYFEGTEQLYNKKLLFHHQIDGSLSHDLQTNLYRIICELVHNAARHSKAETITINIQTTPTSIAVSINDDGQGFIRKLNGQVTTLGLQSAESRVLYMKGDFNLQSEKGRGTLIDIKIPLQFNEPEVNRL